MVVKRWGVAVIGAGMGMKPHGASLVELAGRAEVIGIFSRSEQRRRDALETFGFPTSSSVEALVSHPGVDAVLILTPPNVHLDIVRLAAAAGKDILLEKPIEATTAKAREAVDVARSAGVKLGITLHYRTRQNARYLAGLVGTGELGELVTASASIRWWRTQSYYDEPGRGTKARDGGGVLLTQAIHALDLFLSLAGPVQEVNCVVSTSRAHTMECEDVASAALSFANGATGSVDATTASYPGFPERLEFVFERATAVFIGESLTVYWRDGSVDHRPAMGEAHGGGADPMAYSHLHHRGILEDFLDALDHNREPLVTGAEALKVHFLIEAMLESSAQRRPVMVPAF